MVDQERKTIRVHGSMVLLIALVALSIVLIMSGTDPSSCPYSPKCVEVKFSEVGRSKLSPVG
jgi:hypothetical protein